MRACKLWNHGEFLTCCLSLMRDGDMSCGHVWCIHCVYTFWPFFPRYICMLKDMSCVFAWLLWLSRSLRCSGHASSHFYSFFLSITSVIRYLMNRKCKVETDLISTYCVSRLSLTYIWRSNRGGILLCSMTTKLNLKRSWSLTYLYDFYRSVSRLFYIFRKEGYVYADQ